MSHKNHCYQNEYADSCKYGEDSCPQKETGMIQVELMFHGVRGEMTIPEHIKVVRDMGVHSIHSMNTKRKFLYGRHMVVQVKDRETLHTWLENYPDVYTDI